MTAGQPWRLEREDDGLALLTLAAPPLNLFDDAVLDGLAARLDELTAQPPRALLVRAEGRVVSGGVDVHLFARIAGDARAAEQLWERVLALPRAIEDLPCPTIFAAHALCLTAAFEIALGCDIILAAAGARFGLVERVVGLTPSAGGPQRLTERAGPARARELIYTGELFDAATLERWNVINRVFDNEHFATQALAFAHDLAAGPTRAHAATKRLVRATLDEGRAASEALVGEVSGALFETRDTQAAVTAFLEHGPEHETSFEGR